MSKKKTLYNVHPYTSLSFMFSPQRNELERVYLEQLQFNINVLSSVYAKYYFDLRSLAEDNGLVFPSEYELLTKERAKKLEVCIHERQVLKG